jgi:hypothetical protein
MKRNQKNLPPPADTPSTRKRRLNKRLQEISARSEQELTALKKSLEKVKTAFKPNRKTEKE